MKFKAHALFTSALLVSHLHAADGSWTGGSSGAWLTGTNWTSSIIPGSTSVTSNTDIATFNVAAQPTVGINMSTTIGVYYLGALDYTNATARTFNNSSTTAGVLTLNGATVNSVANTILRNSTTTLMTVTNGTGAGSLGLALGNATNNVVQITNSGGITINSIISGVSRSLTLQGGGAGILTLAGANTYTGATTVSAGVLNIQNATALGTTAGGASVTGGAALQIQGGITVGAEALTLNGTGISSTGALRNISGNNTYGGLVTLGSATRINSDSGTLTLSNAGTITGAFGLTVGGIGNTTISSIIGTGANTLTKDGAGFLILSGANTYTGGSSINSGTLVFRTLASKSASGTHAFGAGTTLGLGVGTGNFTTTDVDNAFAGTMSGNLNLVSVDATTNVGIDTTAGNLTYSSSIGSVTRGLAKFGANTLTLSGDNAYTGATTIAEGTVSVATLANAGSNSGIGNFATPGASGLQLSGGNLTYTGGTTITDRGFTLNTAATTINVATAGAKLTLGNSSMTLVGGTPTITVSGGVGSSLDISDLQLGGGSNRQIAANIPVNIASATLTSAHSISNTGSALITLGTLTGSSGVFVAPGSGGITITGNVSAGGNFSAAVTSSGLITYTGNSLTATLFRLTSGGGAFVIGGAGTIGTSGTFSNNFDYVAANSIFRYGSSATQTLSGNMNLGTNIATGSMQVTGTGTLILSGTNTYGSGLAGAATTVNTGVLIATTSAALSQNATAGKVLFNGGIIAARIGGAGWTTTQVDTMLAAATKTSGAFGIDTTNGTLTQWTPFTTTNLGSSLGLAKLGANTLTLDQTNTYTGLTTVRAGKLTVSAGDINATSAITIGTASTAAVAEFNYNSSTALTQTVSFAAGSTGGKLSGSGTIPAVTVTSGNTLAPGNSPGTLTVSGATTMNSSSIFEWDIATTNPGDQTAGTDYDSVKTTSLAGGAAIFNVVLQGMDNFTTVFWDSSRTWTNIFSTDGTSATALNLSSIFSSFTYTVGGSLVAAPSIEGAFSFTDGSGGGAPGSTLTWTAVPEPSSALAGLLLGAGLLRRRRR